MLTEYIDRIETKLAKLFRTPECQRCGESMIHERHAVTPVMEDTIERISIAFMSTMLVGAGILIGGAYYEATQAIFAGFLTIVVGMLLFVLMLPYVGYKARPIGYDRLTEFPYCFQCRKDLLKECHGEEDELRLELEAELQVEE